MKMLDTTVYRKAYVKKCVRKDPYNPFKTTVEEKFYVFRPNSQRAVNAVLELERLRKRIEELENG